MRYKKMRDRILVSRIASTLKPMSVGTVMPRSSPNFSAKSANQLDASEHLVV